MLDYLKTSSNAEPSVELNTDDYQLIKNDGFYLYIKKQSNIVIRFDYFNTAYDDKVSVYVIQDDNILCQYYHPIHPTLKFKYFYTQWLEHLVVLAQNCFFFLLPDRERQEVVHFLNTNTACAIQVQTLDNFNVNSTERVFLSMHIYDCESNNFKKINKRVSIINKAGNRLMVSNYSSIVMDTITRKLVRRYDIKEILCYQTLNKEFHYYEISLKGDCFDIVTIVYDEKEKIATFTTLINFNDEFLVDRQTIDIENDQKLQVNIFNILEKRYLCKYPSEALINHFKEGHIDISDGIGTEHLPLLDMLEI